MPIVGPDPALEPCSTPWVGPDDLPCSTVVAQASSPDVVLGVCDVASDLLWALSARRFGPGCPVVLRPCLWSACDPTAPAPDAWRVLPCGRIGAEVPLGSDVYAVDLVLIDGVPFNEWRVDNRQTLVRTDGEPWPSSPDVYAADTEPGTWSVTVRYGAPIPPSGLRAVKVLACELLKARVGDTSCRLPARTRNVVRQGLTVEVIDPQEFLSLGRTGITEVDHFIAAYNPRGLASRSTVMSPDYRSHRRPR